MAGRCRGSVLILDFTKLGSLDEFHDGFAGLLASGGIIELFVREYGEVRFFGNGAAGGKGIPATFGIYAAVDFLEGVGIPGEAKFRGKVPFCAF